MFFFFKQKTAYEMRISDWSSDVCSSDLALVRRYLQAVIDGDVDTVEGVQHPDCKWWVVGQGDIDRETFNAMTRSGLLAAEKRSLEIISMTAEGDREIGRAHV